MINPLIFRAYDIRGIASDPNPEKIDLTADTIYLIGKGTGTYLQRTSGAKNIAVGRDNRLTGEVLQKAFIEGLAETGMNVTNLGLCTSPMIYWATCALTFDAGVNISASHNPKEYNGVKIVSKNAHALAGDELAKIKDLIEKWDFIQGPKKGKISNMDIEDLYIKDLCSRINLSKKLKVVVDTGNGVAGLAAPKFLKKLGCEVVELYCELDGNFPNHEANPEELHNMRDLIDKVLEEKADLGIGFDGDGDRIGVVDEKGHMYSSDFMLLLLANDLAKRIPNPKVVFDVKVSQVIINDMKKHGIEPIMCRVGHSFIEQKMREVSAPFAGEVSGHLFFGENYYGFDDAIFAAGKILELLSKSLNPMSAMFIDLPKSVITPEFKASCPDNKKFEIVKKLVDHFTKLYDCITIDGVRINFDENSWGAVRASNTSPNLTLRFEALTQEKLREIQKIMVTELQKYPEISLDWYKK